MHFGAAPAYKPVEIPIDGAAGIAWGKQPNQDSRSQAMATLLTAPLQRLAPSRGSHANAESMCLGTPTPIGLVSPLQSSDSLLSSYYKA
jgi:hypothetical protein